MGNAETEVLELLRGFLVRLEKPVDFELGTRLYADGLELDSLETAELSALLEDEFGTDPFSAEAMPRTVGDLVNFYATAA